METGRSITGLILLIIGFVLIILSVTLSWFMLIYGVPLFLIGLFILLNKKEDTIERRKDLKERKYNN
ncbi:MAG: hypothetical protein ACP5NZ_03500 [Nanobdellota archaeon]